MHDTILVPAVFCSLRQRRFEMTETKIPVEYLVVCGIFDTVSLKSRDFVLSPRPQLEDKPNQKAAFVWLAHKVMTKNLDVFSQNWFLRASIEMAVWHRKLGRCTVFTCWLDVGQFPNNNR